MAKEKGNGNWWWDALKETGKEMVKETVKAAAERRAAIEAGAQPERRRDRRRSKSQKENKELLDFVVKAGGKLMNWWDGDSEQQAQRQNDASETQTRPSGAAAASEPAPEAAARPTPPPRPPPHTRQQSQPQDFRPHASAPTLDDLDGAPDSTEKVEVSECCVCMDNRSNCVFLPCGHLVACKGCASQLHHCPLCRQRITRVQQVFFG